MEKVKINVSKIGYVSLVGFFGEFPRKYGNYFSCDDHHILNMWCENLEHLIEIGVLKEDDEIAGVNFNGGVVITDSRIPDGYLNEKMCFTGSHYSIGPMDELYKFFYTELYDLDCMCNEQADYKSYKASSWTMGDYPMKLSSGICHICRRPIFQNHGVEISEEEHSVLLQQFNELAWPSKK